jgi:hypothetical protein
MKRLICLAGLCLAAPVAARAQDSTACRPAVSVVMESRPSVPTDSVSSELRRVLDCYSNGLIVAAEWIPPDKYNQRILAETVGANILHVAYVSAFACSKISGVAAPNHAKLDAYADKDSMIEWLKSSTDFCKQAFSKLSDAKMGESVPWDGFADGWRDGWTGQRVTRFAAASWITHVLIERYGALVGYMQVGGALSTIASVPFAETGRPPATTRTQPEPTPSPNTAVSPSDNK